MTEIDNQHNTANALTTPLNQAEKKVLDEYLDYRPHNASITHSRKDSQSEDLNELLEAREKALKNKIIKSPGEKIFEQITYRGVGWLGQVAFALWLGDMFKHGAGKHAYRGLAERIAPWYSKAFKANKTEVIRAAESNLNTLTLLFSGNLFLFPLEQAERNKHSIVTWLDNTYNSVFTPTKMDLAIQERAHERIEDEPHIGWKGVGLGRALAIAAVVSTNILLVGRDKLLADKLSNKVVGWFKKSPTPSMSKLGKSPRFQSLLTLGAMELYQSFYAEEVLHLSNKQFKKMKKQKLLEAAGNDNLELAEPIHQIHQPLAEQEAEEQPTSKLDKVIDIASAKPQLTAEAGI